MTRKTTQKKSTRTPQRGGTRQTSRWTPVTDNPFAVPTSVYRETF